MIWTIVMWIVGLAAVAVAAILIVASAKPDTFRIERRISIKAPPEEIFPLINDFHAWTQWSPWERKDPALKRSYSGATSGKGSIYEWEGNKNVGKGRMEIAESRPSSKVLVDLYFLSPFAANNTAEFTLTPGGEATTVNWAMYGPSLFVSKVMSTVMNMDKMVGKDFEQGLVNMKAAAER
jgi:carbon monoxide dehydrogenase subunit G